MAPGLEIDASKYDAEAARFQQLPAAMNNNGNLFRPLSSNVYVEEVEKLRRAGKVGAEPTSLPASRKNLDSNTDYTGSIGSGGP